MLIRNYISKSSVIIKQVGFKQIQQLQPTGRTTIAQAYNITVNNKGKMRMEKENTKNIYDAVVTGGGPAGLIAAIYAIRQLSIL